MARVRSQSAWVEDVVEPGGSPPVAATPAASTVNALPAASSDGVRTSSATQLSPQCPPASPTASAVGSGAAAHPLQPRLGDSAGEARIDEKQSIGRLRRDIKSGFCVTVERAPAETIGINLDVTDGSALLIVDILPGAIQAWNDAHIGEMTLQVNDRIIEANGAVGDSDKLLTALKQNTTWHLAVQRPVEIRAVIVRDGANSLGMDLRYAPNGTSLMISQVDDGPIKEWNEKSANCQIKPLDRIIEVNGRRGSTRELLDSGKESDTLEIVILHYD